MLEQFKVKQNTVKNPHLMKILQRHFCSILGTISANELQETNAKKCAGDTKIDGDIDSDKGKVSPVKSFRTDDKMGFA